MTAKVDLEDLILALRDIRTIIKGRSYLEVSGLTGELRSSLASTLNWQADFLDGHKDKPLTRYDLAGAEERQVLDETRLGRTVSCETCSWLMNTEGEFQRHYVIDNIRYPNLASCWTKHHRDQEGTRPEWTLEHLSEEQARGL